ncbi:MAG TPA: DUF1553 domain-containing protein [Pirellulaceae bacterium]|nr:DUF1553 domain-containing protein [Pirellulaceae bacterium]
MTHRLIHFVVFSAATVVAADWASAEDRIDYIKQIKPILSAKCYSCHGAFKREAELRLETRALMLQGGDSGEVIVAGEADASLLIERITAEEDERMPPPEEGGTLKAEEIALIRAWINQGAETPMEETPGDPREHWAYRKPVRANVPQVKNVRWVRNPIDAFLAAGHEQLGLVPVPRTDSSTLLRRVYLDLIGLPPTRQQLQAFLADESKDAYDKVVRDLLESPRYGERWGRHWMDIWRYSDWSGYRNEVRNSQRHIWRWRDWIIQSLNEDKPYDRMIIEMLAGDEIAPTDPDTLRATGFLARNWFLFNRDTWIDTTIEHTSKAFLGLTMNCTKCHDHKYDPIAQIDYYRMRAFFEPHHVRVDALPGETNLDKNGLSRIFDAYPEAPTYLYVRGNAAHPDKSRVISPGVPAVLAFEEPKITPVSLPAEASNPALQQFVLEDHLRIAEREIQTARAAVEKAKKQVAATEQDTDPDGPAELTINVARAELLVAERSLAAAELRPTTLRTARAADLARFQETAPESSSELVAAAALAARHYELAKAHEAVARAEQKLSKADSKTKENIEKELSAARASVTQANKALEQPGEKYSSLQASLRAKQTYGESEAPRRAPYARVSTGRRSALARWIANRNNPLTARVAVNHIWLRHFGAPLVDSVFDFGLRSEQPRHSKLLDWLAVEFMENGWSMKELHRLIVTSNAYRMRSAGRDAATTNFQVDADNHFLWRMNSRRLEAEAIRDSILYVAGELDTTEGGPEVDYRSGQTNKRRSMYFQTAYEKQMKFLVIFDEASVNECYRRTESVVPHHALALSNSTLSFDQSRLLARNLLPELKESDDADHAFITLAFQHVLSRAATESEVEKCREFLTDQALRLASIDKLTPFSAEGTSKVKPSADPEIRARENLIHVLMNHNDFVTIR